MTVHRASAPFADELRNTWKGKLCQLKVIRLAESTSVHILWASTAQQDPVMMNGDEKLQRSRNTGKTRQIA